MAKTTILGLACALGLSISALSANAGQRDFAFFDRAPIAAWHGQRFNVVRIDSIDKFDGLRTMLEDYIRGNPDQVQALNAAIRANGPLVSALRSRSVQINNIAAIQHALSGNLVFYLR